MNQYSSFINSRNLFLHPPVDFEDWNVPELVEACKIRHSNIHFYRDFIMSKQENADFIFAFETFHQFDNKSALLLKFRQCLAPNGKLIIIQSTRNMTEFDNHMSILEKTHGLQKLYQSKINPHVNMALHKIGSYGTGVGQGAMIDEYFNYSANLSRDEDFNIMVSIFENK
jgi:hypothetical protein